MSEVNQSNLVRIDLSHCQYVVLHGKLPRSSPYFELYKNTYCLWKQTWEKAFSDVGSPEFFSPDDFYRQDFIPVICHKNEPIAAHFSSLFERQNPAAMDHHYFNIFPPKSMAYLAGRGVETLMSIEFLTVNSNFRKSIIGFSLADVLVSLSAKLQLEFNIDVGLGIALKALKVEKIGIKLNYEIIADEVRRGNLVCNIMAGFWNSPNLGKHPDQNVQNFVSLLWNNRVYDQSLFNEAKKVA